MVSLHKSDQVFHRQIGIPENLAQQTAPNVLADVNRDRHNATIRVSQANMAPLLSHDLEPGGTQGIDHLSCP